MIGSRKAVATALVLVLVASVALVAAASSSDASASCWTYRPGELKTAARLNKVRAARELGGLRLDPELSRVARSHTKAMVRARALFHTSPEKLATRVTNWLVLGENVGKGGGVRRIVRRMMNSEAHAANVLEPAFVHIGVGTTHAAGRLWVTVTFEARRDPGTTLWMPRC